MHRQRTFGTIIKNTLFTLSSYRQHNTVRRKGKIRSSKKQIYFLPQAYINFVSIVTKGTVFPALTPLIQNQHPLAVTKPTFTFQRSVDCPPIYKPPIPYLPYTPSTPSTLYPIPYPPYTLNPTPHLPYTLPTLYPIYTIYPIPYPPYTLNPTPHLPYSPC